MLNAIGEASPENPLMKPIHGKAVDYLKRFLVVGGMPEVVAGFAANQDLQECQRALDDLIITLKADFSKYKKRVPELRLTTVFDAVVQQMGGKFVYSKVGQEYNHKQLKESMELMQMAGLVIPVIHSSANGLPFFD